MVLRLAALGGTAVLALIGGPRSLRAQTIGAKVECEHDSTRYVYQPNGLITVVMHRDTVRFVRANAAGARIDTVTFLVCPDSAWLLVRERRMALTAYRAGMLRREIKSNKQAISLDSVLAMPK